MPGVCIIIIISCRIHFSIWIFRENVSVDTNYCNRYRLSNTRLIMLLTIVRNSGDATEEKKEGIFTFNGKRLRPPIIRISLSLWLT